MAQDISNLPISSSFQDLVLQSGSFLQNATGSVLTDINVTASMAITASHALNVPATASFALNADSASHAERADTASVAIQADSATQADSASFATTASFIQGNVATSSYALTASFLQGTIESASFAQSSSIADLATLALTATTASYSVFADTADDLLIAVKNTSGNPIIKGEAVYATGVTGENINVSPADNQNAATMPAIGIAQDNIANGAAGFVVAMGIIRGIDTSTFQAGRNVFVGENGLTATKPTGSALIQNIAIAGKIDGTDGEIVVTGAGRSNDLPNITSGHAWVGNEDQVPTAISTASLSVGTATSASHSETASIANSIKAGINADFGTLTATSASFTYLQSVTGSATIIGDAYVVLNNDTPVERYAGIIVRDSGSAENTSSFEYDGQTDDWFFEKEVAGDAHFGVALFGPEYGTKGSPQYIAANTIPKGVGDHHLVDSSIVDNGTNVTISNVIVASAGISGSLHGDVTGTTTSASFAENARTADSATSASEATNAATATTASHALSIPGVISNDVTFNGSVNGGVTALSIASSTASVDMSAGNFFTLAMPAGGAVHITATNKQAGQTINIQSTQNATAATLDFNSEFKFESGSVFTASTGSGIIDLMSFVTFDSSNILGTGINHLV